MRVPSFVLSVQQRGPGWNVATYKPLLRETVLSTQGEIVNDQKGYRPTMPTVPGQKQPLTVPYGYISLLLTV